MSFITISRTDSEGRIEQVDSYPTDTDSEIAAAKVALVAAGLESAPVRTGEPDDPDSYESGEVLWAATTVSVSDIRLAETCGECPCPRCGQVYDWESHSQCPACGHEPAPLETRVEVMTSEDARHSRVRWSALADAMDQADLIHGWVRVTLRGEPLSEWRRTGDGWAVRPL